MKKNIYLRFYFAIFSLGLIVLGVTGLIIKGQLYDSTTEGFKEKAEQVLSGIIPSIDVEKILKYKSSMQIDDEYREIVRNLDKIKDNVSAETLFVAASLDENNNAYIYYTSEYGDGIEDSTLGRKVLGDTFPVDAWSTEIFSGSENYQKSYIYDENNRYGNICVAVQTLKDPNGKVVAFAGLNYGMKNEIKVINKSVLKFFTNLFIAFVVNITLVALIAQFLIITPIRTISKSVSNLVNENRDKIVAKEIKIRNKNDDIGLLAKAFNRMILDLHTYTENIKKINAEKEQIATELNIANQIQTSLIPHTFPAFPELNEIDIYARSKPAKEVGGDFYDFFLVGDSHIAFVIADVSGKGISAALFMVIARTLIRNETSLEKSPGEILKNVNAQMCVENNLGMFITLFFGFLNYKTGELKFSNAGHLKPILRSRSGKFKELNVKKNFVIAGMPNLEFKDEAIQLYQNDVIFMYTDGITESMDKESKNWGVENLLETLNNLDFSHCSLKQMIEIVQSKVKNFSGGNQSDDETILVVKYRGNK